MSGVTRTFGPLHFEDLEPRRFEDLVRQLIYDFRQWRMLEATGRAGSDDGFDARGFEIVDLLDVDESNGEEEDDEKLRGTLTDRLWLIQCKREKTITPAKLQAHLDAMPSSSIDNLYGVIFVAACDFSKKARDVFRTWCSAKGISEAHIWGKAELEDQLYQPKNDGLLFAYFGFSLRIRRRSVKTELRARIAMKRKAERIIQNYQTILLRDSTDDRYPYPVPEKDLPCRWRVVQFHEHHPWGLVILVRRYFAYLSDDQNQWDYIESSVSPGVNPYQDPWHDKEKRVTDHLLERKIYKYWSNLPDKNQANCYIFEIIEYEEILDIDEKGDSAAKIPHVYLESVRLRKERRFIENLERYNPVRVSADSESRVEFFPKEFPEIEPSNENP